jgi:hypothetical protein
MRLSIYSTAYSAKDQVIHIRFSHSDNRGYIFACKWRVGLMKSTIHVVIAFSYRSTGCSYLMPVETKQDQVGPCDNQFQNDTTSAIPIWQDPLQRIYSKTHTRVSIIVILLTRSKVKQPSFKVASSLRSPLIGLWSNKPMHTSKCNRISSSMGHETLGNVMFQLYPLRLSHTI